MRRFLVKTGVFLGIGALIFPSFFYLRYYKSDVNELIWRSVYWVLEKSVTPKKDVKTLVLGDSIGEQAYSWETYNDRIFSLACNQAISVAGQYLLYERYLNTNKNAVDLDVVLIYRPSSFRNDLDQPFSFNYFLKPFYNQEFEPKFTEHLKAQIESIPYHNLAQYDVIKNSNWSPAYKVGMNKPQHFMISQTSAEYVKKMYALSQERGVRSFKIICPFISDEFSIADFSGFKEDIEELGLVSEFEGYFDQILFLDRDLFKDKSHLKDPEAVLKPNYLNL